MFPIETTLSTDRDSVNQLATLTARIFAVTLRRHCADYFRACEQLFATEDRKQCRANGCTFESGSRVGANDRDHRCPTVYRLSVARTCRLGSCMCIYACQRMRPTCGCGLTHATPRNSVNTRHEPIARFRGLFLSRSEGREASRNCPSQYTPMLTRTKILSESSPKAAAIVGSSRSSYPHKISSPSYRMRTRSMGNIGYR